MIIALLIFVVDDIIKKQLVGNFLEKPHPSYIQLNYHVRRKLNSKRRMRRSSMLDEGSAGPGKLSDRSLFTGRGAGNFGGGHSFWQVAGGRGYFFGAFFFKANEIHFSKHFGQK